MRDGVLVQPDDGADLGVAPVVELAQREHEPLPGQEPRVGEADILLLVVEKRAALGIVLDRRRRPRLGHVRDGLRAPAALDRLEEKIAKRREEIRRNVGRVGIEPVEARQSADERFLHEVVGVVPVAGQPVGERPQPRAVRRVDVFPGRPVALTEPADEDGVSARRRRRHASSLRLPVKA